MFARYDACILPADYGDTDALQVESLQAAAEQCVKELGGIDFAM